MPGGNQRRCAACVAEGERRRLAVLPKGIFFIALLDFLNRYAVELACRRFIDLAVRLEHVQHPLLARQPRHDSRLDSREVRVNKRPAGRGDKRRADELGKRVRYAAEDELQAAAVPVLHQLTCQR
jgi:hypothetical protein